MTFYIFFLLSSMFTLSVWHVLKEGVLDKLSGILFYLSIIGFAVSAIGLYSQDQLSAITLFRDIIGLAGISMFFMFVKENKILAVGSLIALGSAMPYMYQYLMEEHQKKPGVEVKIQDPVKNHVQDSKGEEEVPKIDQNSELLIEVNKGFTIASIMTVIDKYDLEVERAFQPDDHEQTDLDDYYSINIPKEQENNLQEILTALNGKRAIEWVELNEIYELSPIESTKEKISPPVNKYVVNDPLVKQKWEYAPMELNQFYQYIKKNKIKAKKKAKLFILDTGVDGEHEDLKGQFKSYDANSSKDDVGHGTHCAGIAASVSNNKIGISSLVPDNKFVEVSGIKVLAGFGFGTQKMIIEGMIKAIDSGADVISMSLGGKSTQQREKAYTEVVEYAKKHNVIVVTAAGNAAKDASLYCPANSAGVIAVAAVDQSLKRTSFSNTLQHIKFGLSAPGKDILSTYPKNEYKNFSGTSMAAPYVSGTIAVLRSIHPSISTEEAFQLLHQTGMETDQPYKTGNFIQPYKAVKKLHEQLKK